MKRALRQPADWARARVLWDQGKLAREIGAVIGRTADAVWLHARKHGWSRRYQPGVARNARAAVEVVAAAPTAKRAAKLLTFRCARCAGRYEGAPDAPAACPWCGARREAA